MPDTPENSRNRLLAATIDLVRANGYAATRVEDICAAAGVTKGSFFHHFASKEELAAAAGEHWGERSMQLFAQAPYLRKPDALDRLLGYIDFRFPEVNWREGHPKITAWHAAFEARPSAKANRAVDEP